MDCLDDFVEPASFDLEQRFRIRGGYLSISYRSNSDNPSFLRIRFEPDNPSRPSRTVYYQLGQGCSPDNPIVVD